MVEQRIPVRRRRLGHQYGVADGLGVFVKGQGHLHNFRPQFLQDTDGPHRQVGNAAVNLIVKIFLDDANTQPPDVAGQCGGVVRYRRVGGGRVGGIRSGDGIHRQRSILDAARHRARMVQAPGQGRQAGPAHPSVGGLKPHDAAERRRNPHAAAGVAAHCDVALPGGGRRPAAAAAAAGNPFRVPGVVHMPIVGILPGGAVGQRVHIELAQQNGARLPEARRHRAVGIGNIGIVNARPRSSPHAGGVEQVFQPHRDAVQRAPVVAPGNFLLGALRRRPGRRRQQGDEGVQRGFRGLNAGQAGVHHIHRGHDALADEPGYFPSGHIMQFIRHCGSPTYACELN